MSELIEKFLKRKEIYKGDVLHPGVHCWVFVMHPAKDIKEKRRRSDAFYELLQYFQTQFPDLSDQLSFVDLSF